MGKKRKMSSNSLACSNLEQFFLLFLFYETKDLDILIPNIHSYRFTLMSLKFIKNHKSYQHKSRQFEV